MVALTITKIFIDLEKVCAESTKHIRATKMSAYKYNFCTLVILYYYDLFVNKKINIFGDRLQLLLFSDTAAFGHQQSP